jgi:dTDP-4-amino-4,6-dideoxygalactose transaminase
MSGYQIPFNKAALAGNELDYIQDAIERGHVSGDGYYTQKCQAFLEEKLGVGKVLLTTSCTHALELAALLLDIQPGDEVIIPSFTFVSTVNAFVLRGAKPVFADIRNDTLNLDETQLAALISPHTKAIVPVHYAGVGCEMDQILAVAEHNGLAVVEDNAHGLFGKYHGQFLGTFGNLATQSFHETKNFTCGEGGAILINHPDLVERAEILREKGTNRSRFFRGQVDKYTWVDIGSSYLPSDMLAAFLYAQFEHAQEIQSARKQIWKTYHTGLANWASANQVQQPFIPAHCEQTYHMYYLLLPSLDLRQRLIAHLKMRGILSVFHYLPLHLSQMGRQFGGQPGDCPVTEQISDRLLRLPFYYRLSAQEQSQVIEAMQSFQC